MKCTKNHRLSYTERAQEIVDKLSLEEKVSLMSGKVSLEDMMTSMETIPNAHYNYIPYGSGGLKEHGVPEMLFCDGPRGVVCDKGKSTCFPVTMCRGASFDRELEKKIGKAVGKEVKAYGGNLFAGICVNLPYNPGWGRSQETYGEESYHLGEMGAALTEGVQEENVIGCVKHYAFNQMEISRFKVSVDCDKRTEREVFLPHFKKIIDAGAASVMSSYNLYHGTKCGHHDYLLNKVLKDEWDFDGFVMSDFGWGVTDTVEAANGGQDMEMCGTIWFGDRLVKAVQDGFVSEEAINDSALRIVRTMLAFGDAEAQEEPCDKSVLACQEHVALALQSAREGITLIQNKHQVLPLSREKAKKIVILGKLGEKENIGDHGSSQVFPPYVVTPFQGISKAAPDSNVVFYDGEDLAYAKEMAADADAVIFVVGFDHDDEGEYVSEDQNDNYTGAMGGDRKVSLGLHEDEIKLVKEVGPVNPNSAVVLIGGNMIMMEEWKDCVSAIMMAYYPGMEGGTAIAEILFGDVNPSGKLPYVIVKEESDLPYVNWDTEFQHYDYYHGYTKLEKEKITPAVPYGFGLSYTTFTIEDPQFNGSQKGITASCKVTNTGNMAGDEVVQLYVGFENSKVDRPVKILRGFERVSLQPGESKTVTIFCPNEELQWYDANHNTYAFEHMEYQVYIGTSSANEDLKKGSVTL
jgi:beta-glucosidase